MNKIVKFAIVAVAVALMGGCGRKDKAEQVPEEVATTISTHDSSLADAINSGNFSQVSSVADSLALMVDDLTPAQSVNVLAAFAGVVDQAMSAHNPRKALETMRKYVDVYDIACGMNPKDMARIMKKDGRMDYDSLVAAYRQKLNDYAYTMSAEISAPSKPDTVTKAETEAEEIPVDIRPAE